MQKSNQQGQVKGFDSIPEGGKNNGYVEKVSIYYILFKINMYV